MKTDLPPATVKQSLTVHETACVSAAIGKGEPAQGWLIDGVKLCHTEIEARDTLIDALVKALTECHGTLLSLSVWKQGGGHERRRTSAIYAANEALSEAAKFRKRGG